MARSTDSAAQRIAALRQQLEKHRVDGFLIPRADQYQGEYVPASAERLAMLTGFTGSAGIAVVLTKRAALLVDGRYTIQSRQEVDTEHFEILGYPTKNFNDWLAAHMKEGERLGYDPTLHVSSQIDSLRDTLEASGIELVPLSTNLVDAIWEDRPAAPSTLATIHPMEYAGKSTDEKLQELRATMKERGFDATLLSAPESVSWLLNLRANDVPFTPLVLAHALISSSQAILFISLDKVSAETRDYLTDLGVTISPEPQLTDTLVNLQDKHQIAHLHIDASRGSIYHAELARQHGVEVTLDTDLTAYPRAEKNDAEQHGTRAAHLRDGAAISRFLCWLDHQVEHDMGALDELTVSDKLLAFRAEHPMFRDSSFQTISGFGSNGAIVHYRASPKTNLSFTAGNLYLIDSGAQYPDGTTDITRTVSIGAPTSEMKRAFTRVLQGHIDLSRTRFPRGTTGHALDVIARWHLWQDGLDFNHGTGHGVGSYLSVHEGPQNISPAHRPVPLNPGMILSNEPGYYKDGAFGIRIENLILVNASEDGDDSKEMLSFETLTLAPIDRRLIEASLLSENQRSWLDAYHARVREQLLPLMKTDEERRWLEQATLPLP